MPKISKLAPTDFPSLQHFVAAAKDNETVKISVQQIRGLMKFAASEIALGEASNVEAALTALSNDKANQSDMVAADNTLGEAISQVAADLNTLGNSALLRYDIAQTLSAEERGRAIANLGASSLSGLGSRVLNGHFSFWQSGEKLPGALSSGYYADQWYCDNVTACTKVTFPDGTFGVRVQSSAHGNPVTLAQPIEDVTSMVPGPKTVVFDVSTGIAGRSLSVDISLNFGVGGSAEVRLPAQLVAMPDAKGRYRLLFDLPTIVGKTIGLNHSVNLNFRKPAGNNQSQDFTVSRVVLVERDARFEEDLFTPIPVALDWVLCQRYFEIGRSTFKGYSQYGTGAWQSFAVRKRISPSMSTSNYEYSGPVTGAGVGIVDISGIRAEASWGASPIYGSFSMFWSANARI